MDRATFQYYAESYGSDFSLWPQSVSIEAQTALKNNPEWQTVLDNEEQLDLLLNQYKLPKANLSPLEQSILDATVHQTGLLDRLINWLRPDQSLWRPAVAACLPILVGITLGTSLELEEQYVLSEEIELLGGSVWDGTLFETMDFENKSDEI